jgi:hypothetical protein
MIAPIHGIVITLKRSPPHVLKRGPAGIEAERQTSEHGENQGRVTSTHTAAVFVGCAIETLMQTVFNAPVASLGFEKLLDGQLFTRKACDQPDGFRRCFLPAHGGVQPDLRRGGKADLFGRRLLCDQAATFFTIAIDFLGADRLTYVGRFAPRGK